MSWTFSITGLMNDRYATIDSADIRRTFNTKRRNGEFIGAFVNMSIKSHQIIRINLLLMKKLNKLYKIFSVGEYKRV
ncbi:hypothetical protein UT300002_27200 [Clostridium perfringens]